MFTFSYSCSFSLNDFQIDNQETSNKLIPSPKSSAKKKKMKSKDDDDDYSSEEERWLHAIESGKLDEVVLIFLKSSCAFFTEIRVQFRRVLFRKSRNF